MLSLIIKNNVFQYGDLNNQDFRVCITVGLKDETLVVIDESNALFSRLKPSTGTSLQRTKDLLQLLDPESGAMKIQISPRTYQVHMVFDMVHIITSLKVSGLEN